MSVFQTATATFMKAIWDPDGVFEQPLAGHGPKQLLKDVVSEQITNTELAGGWLRMYIGVVTMDPSATYPDPSNAEFFTNSDMPGAYNGSLQISATIQ